MARYEDAYAALQRAVRRDPLSRLAQAQLIAALQGLGRLAEARENLLVLMKMYPDYTFAPAELGELLLSQGQLDAAVPYLRSAHAAKTSPRATFALANAYLNLGLEDEVRTTLAEIDYAPRSQPFAEVILLSMRGDDAAMFQFAQAQLAQTNDPIWRALLINSALTLGDLPTARRELMLVDPDVLTSLDAARTQPEAALFAGELLTREGNADAAKRVLESLLENAGAATARLRSDRAQTDSRQSAGAARPHRRRARRTARRTSARQSNAVGLRLFPAAGPHAGVCVAARRRALQGDHCGDRGRQPRDARAIGGDRRQSS